MIALESRLGSILLLFFTVSLWFPVFMAGIKGTHYCLFRKTRGKRFLSELPSSLYC